MLEFRHWKAQSRCFSISYQKIPHLDWGVGLLSGGLQLPMFSWKFWHRMRQVSHLEHLLLRGSYQQSQQPVQWPRRAAKTLSSTAVLCLSPVLFMSSCLSSPSCFASVPPPVEPSPRSQDRLVNVCARLVLVTTDCAKCLWIHVVSVTGCWITAGFPSHWKTQLCFPPSALFVTWWAGVGVIRPHTLAGPEQHCDVYRSPSSVRIL